MNESLVACTGANQDARHWGGRPVRQALGRRDFGWRRDLDLVVEVAEAELAAGGVLVLAARAAEHRLDAVFHKDVEEHKECRLVRRLEVGAVRDGRKGDEIHFRHRDAADLPRELFGAGARVVDTFDDGVLKRDDALCRGRVVGASGKEFVDPPFLIDGHQLRAEGVVRRVEGDGKFELDAFCGETLEAGNDTAGRKGDMARAEVGSAPRVDEFQGAHRLVVVGERFAHPHHDDVGDFTEATPRHIFGDDFIRRQRADDPARAARAKGAAHRATDLRRDALGEASSRGDEDGFDGVAVREAEEEFLRPVRRLGDIQGLARGDREFRFERLAEILWERGCLIPIGDVVAVERVQNLIGTERAQSAFRQNRFPLLGKNAPGFSHGAYYSTWIWYNSAHELV